MTTNLGFVKQEVENAIPTLTQWNIREDEGYTTEYLNYGHPDRMGPGITIRFITYDKNKYVNFNPIYNYGLQILIGRSDKTFIVHNEYIGDLIEKLIPIMAFIAISHGTMDKISLKKNILELMRGGEPNNEDQDA